MKLKMSAETANSLLNMCRTCMIKFSERKKRGNIKNQSISEIPAGSKKDVRIMEILQLIQPQIKVEIKDNLPSLMCFDCINKLIMTHEFIEMYKNADKKLREMFKETDNVTSCETVVNGLEIITEKEMRNKDGSHEIAEHDLQIEELSIQDIEKDEESDWPEFDDDSLHEESKSDNDKEYLSGNNKEYLSDSDRESLFENPFSDVSEDEWLPESSNRLKKNVYSQKNTSQTDITHKQTDNDGDSITKVLTSEKVPQRNISKPQKEGEEHLELCVGNDDSSVKCRKCDKVLEGIKLWKDHMRKHRHENKSKRKCLRELNKPRKGKVKQKYFKCEHCGKEFSKRSPYNQHVRTHSDEAPFLCIECGKHFRTGSGLNVHMLRHKGEKTYHCPNCPMKFVCASGLYSHALTHSKIKPHVCDICGRAYHQAYQLKQHKLCHNGIKKHPCEYCDRKFLTKEKAKLHMRTHTGEKPYRCKYCDRGFARGTDCVKHLRRHLGDNVYQCELCPLRFPLYRDMRAHFATHKDDDEETRARNLKAHEEEERNLQIKFGQKKPD